MKNSHFKAILGAVGASAIMMSSPALANFQWTSGSTTLCPQSGCTTSDNINGTDITATATAWTTPDSSVSSGLVSANSISGALKIYGSSGLGVDNPGESSPHHATDANGKKEAILFSFSKSVELTKVTMGWKYNDADFSLLRFKSGDSSIAGKSYSDLTSGTGSWELVGNYAYSNGKYNDSHSLTANVNPTDGSGNRQSSSLWLVAALNSAHNAGGWSTNNDYFKLKSLVANYTPPTGVPEPSTLALMSISITAFGFTQRRRRKAVSA
ncbi:MAG: PEP-CTERM sorting domain-containing protein [Gammaproteobacteria bacterium]|nr:PEP-CTERM sorting domain-containing protein [Gammaproteobacteria bacterium]